MMIRRLFALIVFSLLFAVAIPANGQAPQTNISYRGEDDGVHLLNVIVPENGTAPYPTILMFHGAPGVNRSEFMTMGLPQFAAEQGYASVLVNYTDSVPAGYSDAFCALAWVYANAEAYALDTERIALFGVSFGGLLSEYIATMRDPAPFLTDCPNTLPDDYALRGIITNSGLFLTLTSEMVMFKPYNLLTALSSLPADTFGETMDTLNSTAPADWNSLTLADDVQMALNDFPIAHVRRREPPHLLIQGLNDTVVPYQDTLNYADSLLDKSVDVQMLFVPRVEHIVPLASFDGELAAFLKRIFR